MNHEQQLKLQAFLDGELPESEAREILSWTQRDSAAATLLAELKNTRATMTQAEPHLSVPESREFFWSKIEREIERQEPAASAPGISIFTALRRWLLPAVAVSAVVIAGMVAHFNVPKATVGTVADADEPTVETTLANSDATTYRDAGEGTTLVWFSPAADDRPAPGKTPTAIN
jgi:anti-sigma factor RsiW